MSVRYVATPRAASRASVEGAGWPNVFFAPTEMSATAGLVAPSSTSDVAVRLPWWATLIRSTWGSPRATRIGSIPSSASPASRNR